MLLLSDPLLFALLSIKPGSSGKVSREILDHTVHNLSRYKHDIGSEAADQTSTLIKIAQNKHCQDN